MRAVRQSAWVGAAAVLGLALPGAGYADEKFGLVTEQVHHFIPPKGVYDNGYRVPFFGFQVYFPLCPGPSPSLYPAPRYPEVAPRYYTYRPCLPYADPSSLESYPALQRPVVVPPPPATLPTPPGGK